MPKHPGLAIASADLARADRSAARVAHARASGFVPGVPQPPARLTQFVDGLTEGMPGLRFAVDGIPVPQGSTRAFVIKGTTRAIVTQGGSKQRRDDLGTWRQAIAARARQAGAVPMLGPLTVVLTFGLLRPKSRPKRETEPDRRPDLDKLVRAALDALTGVAFVDDAQIVRCVAEKRYEASFPGLTVTLTST